MFVGNGQILGKKKINNQSLKICFYASNPLFPARKSQLIEFLFMAKKQLKATSFCSGVATNSHIILG